MVKPNYIVICSYVPPQILVPAFAGEESEKVVQPVQEHSICVGDT